MLHEQPTVFVVDDEPAVAEATAELLRSESLTAVTFTSGKSFLAHYVDQPGCLILDLSMPDVNGLTVQATLNQRKSRLPIIFVTGQGAISQAVLAVKRGASDFLEKPIDPEVLLKRVRDALEQNRLDRVQAAEAAVFVERMAMLTSREQETLQLICEGKTSKQAAKDLAVSHRTVEAHRASIMAKLQVETVTQLVETVTRLKYKDKL